MVSNNGGLFSNLTGNTVNGNEYVVTANSAYNSTYAMWKFWNFITSPTIVRNEWANNGLVSNYWLRIQFLSSYCLEVSNCWKIL